MPIPAIIGAITALASLASAGAQAAHKDPTGMLPVKDTKLNFGPGLPLGNVQQDFTPMQEASAHAMAPQLPQSVQSPMDLLAATRTDEKGQQSVLDALKQASQGPQQQAQAQRAPAAAAPDSPAQASNTPFNPAPRPNENDVSSAPIDAASAAGKSGSTFLGMDGGQWGAIGTASGIVANLMKKMPAPPVISPGGRGPGAIPMGALGDGLSQAGSQHIGSTSQFAINSPSVGSSDILRAMRGQGQ